MTDTLDQLLDEVRAHLAWEAARGHVGIAYEPPERPSARGASAPRSPERTMERGRAPAPSGMPEEAAAFLRQLKGQPAGPVPGQRTDAPSAPSAPAAAHATPAAPAPSAPRAAGDRGRLPMLAQEIRTCTKCRLHEGRTQTVFARGNPAAEVLFVGEGPGYNEDKQGEPFVGQAGQLLDKMIEAMGLGADGVYICNVVKCRPPENRTPLPDEAGACMPYLREQIGCVAPRIIVALGRCAAENLGCALPGRSWRGTWGTFDGIPVMPTYHPAYLLRSPEMKRPVWEDLQKVMQRIKS